MVDAGAAGALWRAVRALPMFRRLLAVRMVSQFADGLFQAGLAGGGLGGALGVLLGFIISAIVAAYAGWPTVITPLAIVLSTGVSGAVGLFSGLYPAIRASRLDPIEALSHN